MRRDGNCAAGLTLRRPGGHVAADFSARGVEGAGFSARDRVAARAPTLDRRRMTGLRIPKRHAVCDLVCTPTVPVRPGTVGEGLWQVGGALGHEGPREHELQPIPGADGRPTGVGAGGSGSGVLLRWSALLAVGAWRREPDRGLLAVSILWMGARIAVLVSAVLPRAG